MEPFLHENGNVTITPTQDFNVLKSSQSSSSRNISSAIRLHRMLKKEAEASHFAGGNQNLQNQIAVQAQRLAAQRKLQKAKMMGNGGMATTMNFQRDHLQNNNSNNNQNDPIFVGSRRARSNNFTLKETFDLLKIWASPEMQWQMKHNFRNFRVWEAISYSMHEMGHDRTAIQCKNRIQNLTSIFYRIKKSKQDYRTFNFPYYKIIGDVLDGKKNGSSITPPPGVNMTPNGSFTSNSGGGSMTISPTSQNASIGSAAHFALIEEYQNLINGNPDGYTTPTGRSSSNNSNSGLNVLSPEVSLSEGNSPIRVETQASRSSNSASTASSSVQKNATSSSRNGNSAGNNSTTAGGCSLIKLEPEDSVTVTTVDDSANASELDAENIEDYLEGGSGGQLLPEADDFPADGPVDSYPRVRTKRSFSASFPPSFSSTMKAGMLGGPSKRSRVGSTSAASVSGLMEDSMGQYLAEMLDLERQWLDMERERAENERQMMVYMMQVLQVLVCPTEQNQDDEDNQDEENENDNEETSDHDGEDDGHDEFQTDQDGDMDENDIHEMIAANGEGDADDDGVDPEEDTDIQTPQE